MQILQVGESKPTLNQFQLIKELGEENSNNFLHSSIQDLTREPNNKGTQILRITDLELLKRKSPASP